MADGDNQNNQHNQGKNKGDGGGNKGGAASGINWGGKLDPAQMGDDTSLGKLVTDQLITATTAVAATAVMYLLCKSIRPLFGVKAQAALPQQQGGGGPVNPGQLTGALFGLKKSDPDKFNEIMGKVNPPSTDK